MNEFSASRNYGDLRNSLLWTQESNIQALLLASVGAIRGVGPEDNKAPVGAADMQRTCVKASTILQRCSLLSNLIFSYHS